MGFGLRRGFCAIYAVTWELQELPKWLQEATKKSDAYEHLLGTEFQPLLKMWHETSIFQATAQESIRKSHDEERNVILVTSLHISSA